MPASVKPRGDEHPERQKRAARATHSLVPGRRGCPQCHVNQVVPANGLADDAATTGRKKGKVGQAEKPDRRLPGGMAFQQFDDVSLMAA